MYSLFQEYVDEFRAKSLWLDTRTNQFLKACIIARSASCIPIYTTQKTWKKTNHQKKRGCGYPQCYPNFVFCKAAFSHLCNIRRIGQFRVALNLIMKARLMQSFSFEN